MDSFTVACLAPTMPQKASLVRDLTTAPMFCLKLYWSICNRSLLARSLRLSTIKIPRQTQTPTSRLTILKAMPMQDKSSRHLVMLLCKTTTNTPQYNASKIKQWPLPNSSAGQLAVPPSTHSSVAYSPKFKPAFPGSCFAPPAANPGQHIANQSLNRRHRLPIHGNKISHEITVSRTQCYGSHLFRQALISSTVSPAEENNWSNPESCLHKFSIEEACYLYSVLDWAVRRMYTLWWGEFEVLYVYTISTITWVMTQIHIPHMYTSVFYTNMNIPYLCFAFPNFLRFSMKLKTRKPTAWA